MDEEAYRVSFSAQFSIEFKNYPSDQQEKILDFVEIFECHGLADFDRYEGKIAPSWNIPRNDPDYLAKYKYARDNNLWHYHIGIPEYVERHQKYKTSDWVLHFQRKDSFNITLVDLYAHYDSGGKFYMPSESYLEFLEEG